MAAATFSIGLIPDYDSIGNLPEDDRKVAVDAEVEPLHGVAQGGGEHGAPDGGLVDHHRLYGGLAAAPAGTPRAPCPGRPL